MPMEFEIRRDRVRRWLNQLEPLRLRDHALGQAALRELPSATGLSEAHVSWALTHAFETDASDADIRNLVASVEEAPAVHVILSSNLFVGALRAIALALASSTQIYVRPSTREPVTAALLLRAAPGAFCLVSEIHPKPGDHVWIYGADSTIAQLRHRLPTGVVLHGHGDGFGLLLVDEPDSLTEQDFDAMAIDIAAFDQRGCLSPRVLLLKLDPARAPEFAERLLAALTRIGDWLPMQTVDESGGAAVARRLELWRYLGQVFAGRAGNVTLDVNRLALGDLATRRTIHVRVTDAPVLDLVGWSDRITAIGSHANSQLKSAVLARCPHVRWSAFGMMQRPRLDGPVDRRTDPRGTVI